MRIPRPDQVINSLDHGFLVCKGQVPLLTSMAVIKESCTSTFTQLLFPEFQLSVVNQSQLYVECKIHGLEVAFISVYCYHCSVLLLLILLFFLCLLYKLSFIRDVWAQYHLCFQTFTGRTRMYSQLIRETSGSNILGTKLL